LSLSDCLLATLALPRQGSFLAATFGITPPLRSLEL
jgi:hypothetical protein